MLQHIIHDHSLQNKYRIAILIKDDNFSKKLLEHHYIQPLKVLGLDSNNIISVNLKYNSMNKAPMSIVKPYIQGLLKGVKRMGVDTLMVCDSTYFKALTGVRKTEPEHGYVKACSVKGFENINVILSVNFAALFHDPGMQTKIDLSFRTLLAHFKGAPLELGKDIIHSAQYPVGIKAVRMTLEMLSTKPALTCDIETTGLQLTNKLLSIAFAWDKHNGVAISIRNLHRNALYNFFTNYQGKLIFHNATFDTRMLIRHLFMYDFTDYRGLIEGLHIMYRNLEDTKIIAYLATNSTAGNHLGLKQLAFEYTGNYAQEEIEDAESIPVQKLLEYNLTDCLATWFVYDKYKPIMLADDQEKVYEEIMRPSLKVVCQMELTGMPINMVEVNRSKHALNSTVMALKGELINIPTIDVFTKKLRILWHDEKQKTYKKKILEPDYFDDEDYNPASTKQTRDLIYEHFGMKVEDVTDTGLPAVGSKILQKKLNQLKSEFNITDEELDR